MKPFDFNKYLKNNPLLIEGKKDDTKEREILDAVLNWLWDKNYTWGGYDIKGDTVRLYNNNDKVKKTLSISKDMGIDINNPQKDFLDKGGKDLIRIARQLVKSGYNIDRIVNAIKQGISQRNLKESINAGRTSPEKAASYIVKQLEKNYTYEELQGMSRQDAIDTVESYGFEGPEVEEIVDMIYMML